MTDPSTTVTRLVGVYDADHTLVGELSYWIGARLGGAHCSLCDITHGLVRERADWRSCRDDLPVPFATFRRNDQPDAVRAATSGRAPVVVAETSDGIVVLLGADELARCEGSPDALVAAIEAELDRRGLST